MLNRMIKIFAPLAMVFLLTACTTEVYSNLSEHDANQMVQVLAGKGIDAERSVATDGTYAISVSRGAFSRAISELNAQGLPRKSFGSLGEVFNSDKLVSTPFEERARFMHAMNEELSKSLTDINGVVSARVLVNLPEANDFNAQAQSPRASVFIYQSEGTDLSKAVPTIKNLVVNSIHNLDYSAVTVALFDAATTSSTQSGAYLGDTGLKLSNLIGMLLLGFLALIGLRYAFSGGSKGKSDKKLTSNV